MRDAMVSWGIVGCGWVAQDYVAPAFRQATNARLIAACDARLDRATALVGRGGTSDLSSFLATPDLDAVYVATPNDSHCAITEAAARAGKHVLCEKPMAACYEDAVRMVEACAEAGVQYATAFDQRFQGRHVALRELVQAGELGTVTLVRIHYACWLPADWAQDNWRIDPARAGGGAFVDLAPHGLDLAQMLLAEPIIDFEVLLQRRVFEYPVDDGGVAIGRTASGALVLMNVAYNCPNAFSRRTLEVIGTKARAEAIDTMGQTPGGRLVVTGCDGSSREVQPSLDRSPFATGIEAFSDAIIRGEPFRFSPEGDLQTARLLERARRPRREP